MSGTAPADALRDKVEYKRVAFKKWAKARGLFVHPGVEVLVPIPNMGLGVVCNRAIAKGETIFSCPHSAYIAPTDAEIANSPAAALIDQHKPVISDWTRVVLRLMAEKGRGVHSPWQAWLAVATSIPGHLVALPPLKAVQKQEAPTELPQEASGEAGKKVKSSVWLPLLRYTGVGQELEDLQLHDKWCEVESFVKTNPSIFPPTIATEKVFCECASFVLSRNFHIEARQRCGPFLVPAVDFINHSATECNVEFKLRGGSKGTKFDVVAAADLQKGMQIYYNYGELSNARFLVEFGFVDPRNRFAGVRLSQALLCELAYNVVLQKAEMSRMPSLEDIASRLKHLVRLGTVYQEGLLLLRSGNPATITLGDAEAVLLDVLYLLTLEKSRYEEVEPSIARWWHVEGKQLGEARQVACMALGWLMEQYPTPETLHRTLLQSNNPFAKDIVGILDDEFLRLKYAHGALSAMLPTVSVPEKKEEPPQQKEEEQDGGEEEEAWETDEEDN